jgi:hypothetical protein
MLEVPAMSKTEPGSVLKTLEADAHEAAWRTAGSQFLKLTREPLIAFLQRHLAPGDEAFRGKIAAFLDTEVGCAMLAALLAAGLTAMPAGGGVGGDVTARIAKELRVRSMADAGNLVAEVLMGPLRQVMATYLRDVAPQIDVRPAQPATLPEETTTTAGPALRVVEGAAEKDPVSR